MAFYLVLILYGILITTFVLMYFFVTYHLVKFSVNASLNKILLPVFIIISALLLFSNILLFFSVDWNSLLSQFNF